jgi:hypothetical protein
MQDKHSWHKQCAAIMARASTEQQSEWLSNRDDIHSTETLIEFERKFFLPRKRALEIIYIGAHHA